MSLLRNLLLDKKIMEDVEEIETFLSDNGIEEGSLIHRIDFDKNLYTDKDMVSDFLNSHFMEGATVDESKKSYSSILFDGVAFIDSSIKEIEFRDGITIVLGMLKPMATDNPHLFSDLPNGNIKLSADHPYIIEIARTVTGFHVNYGEVKITKEDLISFKNNFDNDVVGVDLSIDFDHETREAAGWIKEVFLSEDGEILLGGIRWTPKGALALSDREFRYLSPEFNQNYLHPHTGVEHGPTLLGAALVNRPFLKMDAIVSLKDKPTTEAIVETIKLTDHTSKVNGLEKDIIALKLSESTAKTTIGNMKTENEKLSEELNTLKSDVAKKATEDKHNKLFTEGKINKAQLDALNEGQDLIEVLQLSEPMNLTAKGDGNADNKTVVKLSDAELKVCTQLDMTPEDFIKYNGGN